MSFIVITRRKEMIALIQNTKQQQKTIGFVPTMGALHNGHGALIKQSVAENDVTVVSIFVNPIQFAANEDLSKYPRQFQKDCVLCEESGVQILFCPTVEEMYPTGFATKVSLNSLSNFLCGQFRPGHFEGVATVVLLLLNIVKPDQAYFGQKDFQQVQVIRQMALDLALESKIMMMPTVREKDGLALSSRNVYLTADARKVAHAIPQSLAAAAKLFLAGERSCEKLLSASKKILKEKNLTPQYLEIRPTINLTQQLTANIEGECVLAIAQIIQSGDMHVRLIDNIILSEDSDWTKVLEELVSCTTSS